MSDSPRRTLQVWLYVFTPIGYTVAAGVWIGRAIRAALPRRTHDDH